MMCADLPPGVRRLQLGDLHLEEDVLAMSLPADDSPWTRAADDYYGGLE